MIDALASAGQALYLLIDTERTSMAERGRPRSFDRETALRRAMDVFWAKGYDATSLADLTSAMGINPPSLYAAFGSKEDLFREAVELYSASEGDDIWSGIELAPTAREAVATMLRASAENFSRPGKPRGCMIVLSALNADEGNAAVCEALRAQRAGNVRQLRRRLERAVAEGELSGTIDPRAIATFYASVQHGMSILARDGASRKTLLSVADTAMSGWDSLVASAPRASQAANS
jgi:AcrR family transcriptional regulator